MQVTGGPWTETWGTDSRSPPQMTARAACEAWGSVRGLSTPWHRYRRQTKKALVLPPSPLSLWGWVGNAETGLRRGLGFATLREGPHAAPHWGSPPLTGKHDPLLSELRERMGQLLPRGCRAWGVSSPQARRPPPASLPGGDTGPLQPSGSGPGSGPGWAFSPSPVCMCGWGASHGPAECLTGAAPSSFSIRG